MSTRQRRPEQQTFNRVIPRTDDRAQLLGIGRDLNHEVADIIGIVTPKTYSRWLMDLREMGPASSPRRTEGAVADCAAKSHHGVHAATEALLERGWLSAARSPSSVPC